MVNNSRIFSQSADPRERNLIIEAINQRET